MSVPPPEDDTLPALPFSQNTKSKRHIPRFVLLLIGLAIVSLVVTITALLFSLPDEDEFAPLPVMLRLNGVNYPVTSYAETVGQFLDEQNLTLESGDVVMPDQETRLREGLVIQLERARAVSVTVDGQTTVLYTTFDNPQDIINSLGITDIDDGDSIFIDGQQADLDELLVWDAPPDAITVRRAVSITVIDGDETQTLQTTEETVGEALFEAGISLFLADSVEPDLSATITPDMAITIDRSREMTIIVDGESIETRTSQQTVGAALADAGIALNGLDYVIPVEDAAVLPGISVRVIRVREELVEEQESIPYESSFQADANLNLDQRQVIQAGQNGLIERTIRIRYENDIEISRTVESEEMTALPQDEIIAYGTHIVLRTVETADGPVQYWRRLRVYATSYHPAALGGDDVTATGRILTKGIVGIDPRIIPYDTNVFVEGYGTGIAADTGGPRSTPYWIDLGYDDENFVGWSEWVTVYLLPPVPETVNYLLPLNERGGPLP